MLVHPGFDPVAIHLGPLAIRWYGLMYLVGFGIAYALGRLRIARRASGRVTVDILDDLLFFVVLGVILGGRLGYVLFYKPAYYLGHPAEILAVWQGGMAFHGGFLGVLLAVWWVARKHRLRWLELTDFLAPLIPLGLAAGRLGNFINAELWGRVTDVPWAMIFPGRRPGSAASVAALPVRARRRPAVRGAVAVLGTAAAGRRGVGAVSDRLRRRCAPSPSSSASPMISSACSRSA